MAALTIIHAVINDVKQCETIAGNFIKSMDFSLGFLSKAENEEEKKEAEGSLRAAYAEFHASISKQLSNVKIDLAGILAPGILQKINKNLDDAVAMINQLKNPIPDTVHTRVDIHNCEMLVKALKEIRQELD